MRSIVVKAAAALRTLAAPGAALWTHDHGAVGFRQNMADGPDRLGVEQLLDLGKGSDEAVVVSDLANQIALGRHLDQFAAFGRRKDEWLFAKHMDVSLQCLPDHRAVQ